MALNLKSYKIKERTPLLINILLQIWEDSVRTSHTFLSDDEISDIKKYVPETLSRVSHLIVAYNKNNLPVGFMGIGGRKLEMLFVSADEQRKGVGKKLLKYALEKFSICELTVNEQNPSAKCFYEYMGFEVYKRTDTDEQANPYPLLYMKIKG